MEEESPTTLSGIFTDAILIKDERELETFLQKSCRGDEELLGEVRGLLESHAATSGTFSRPFATLPEIAAEREEVDPWLDLPRPFGNYVLEEVIGQGGMGVIYRATQIQLNRVVALKMIRNAHLATRKEIQRFYTEARSAAKLNHHGVVPIIETGEFEEQHFFSMGYVDGMNLAEAVKTKSLSRAQVLFIVEGVAAALAYTHSEGVIHRDLKPENILLSNHGSDPSARDYYHPHISDFGLAKILHQSAELTMAGEIFGTPAYMSPEQAKMGAVEITPSSDVYSAGALMYFALTGKPPFEGSSVWTVLRQVEHDLPPRPSKVKAGIPNGLETICLKCLEKDPAKRYSSAAHFWHDLENYRTKRPLIAKRESPFIRLYKFCRRHPTSTVGAVLGGLLIGALTLLKQEREINQDVFTLQEPVFQTARTEFSRAMQLAVEGNQNGALQTFIETASLAQETKDPQTERLARYSIGALQNELWSLDSSIPLTDDVSLMVTSGDGHSLATASDVGGIRVMQLSSKTLELDDTLSSPVTSLAFHPSYQFLVAACEDGVIHIWQRRAGQFVKESQLSLKIDAGIKSQEKIHSIGFSSGGETMFTASRDRRVVLWNFEERKVVTPFLQLNQAPVKAMVAGEANLLVVFGGEGSIHGWDATTGRRRFGPVVIAPELETGAVDIAGETIYVTSPVLSQPRVYDIRRLTRDSTSLRARRRINPGNNKTFGDFSPHSGKLLTLNQNRTLHFYDSEFGEGKLLPLRFRTEVSHFALTQKERLLCTVHPGIRTLLIWKAPEIWNNRVTLSPSFSGGIISKGGESPIVSLGRQQLRLFRSPEQQARQNQDEQVPDVIPLTASPQGAMFHQKSGRLFLLQKTSPPSLICFDTRKKEILWQMEHPHEGELKLALDEKGKRLAIIQTGDERSGGKNLSIVILRKQTLRSFRVPAAELRAVTFSPGRSHTVILSSDEKGLLWYHWKDEEVTREKATPGFFTNALSSSKNGNLVVLGRSDEVALVYREKDWREYSPPVSHTNEVHQVSFARNGELVVSGGGSGSAKVWEASSGLAIGSLLRHDGVIDRIEVCEASGSITTSTTMGEVKFWPIPKKDERDLTLMKKVLGEEFPAEF